MSEHAPEPWKIIRLNREQDDFDAFGVVDPQGLVTEGFASHVGALMHALECANAEPTRIRAELAEAHRHAKVLARDLTWFARMVKASYASDSDVGRALEWARELKP